MIDHEPIEFRSLKEKSHYELCLANGCSPRLAEVLATRSFPSVKTDATFNQGRCNGNQFEHVPGRGNSYKALADAAGVSVTGKHYCAGLADYPGDPTAWVSDRGDVLRVARMKNMKVTGDVNYTPHEVDPGEDIPIAREILEREVERAMEQDPGRRLADVEEQQFNRLTGKVDLSPELLVKD